MSGHSKWATIKHKKGALDAKRGKIFTRLLKEIAVAAKGGGNPDTNARLRTAVLAAKAENMPQDNIKRAILRGTGELEGVNYEEISFEGYGPGGVAIIVDVLTDNRNRAVSEIRHAFSKNGGNLGESGSVRFMFHKKGLIAVEKGAATEEQLMDIVLEHGGEDLNDEGDTWEIVSDPADHEAVAAAVKAAGIPTVMSEVTMVGMPAALTAAATASWSAGSETISQVSPSSFRSSPPCSSTMSINCSSVAAPFSTAIRPFLWNMKRTEPDSPRLPPFLEKAWRISLTARLRLSVSTSTIMATPPGP